MSADLGSLSVAAVTIGFIHCLCGPDHYIPFVAMSRVGLWSLRKTLVVTALCGVGHVAGSALLGFIGIALGLIVFQLEGAESIRGDVAGWLLVAFGLGYSIWGVVHAARCLKSRNQPSDSKAMDEAEGKVSALAARAGRFTPWVLFTIFVFGPCEPLIPLLMYPAAKANVWSVVCVTVLFGLTTLATMTVLVAMIYKGTSAIRFRQAEVYGHAMAGLIVLACGLAIMFGL